jgi:hypothetical protein
MLPFYFHAISLNLIDNMLKLLLGLSDLMPNLEALHKGGYFSLDMVVHMYYKAGNA